MKADPNSTTNAIASLRTELADKDRRIAQLNNTAEKLNKQKMQSTTLMNSLQRENSAKDALIHQAKNEIEKLRKQLREKEVTISSMSTKVRLGSRPGQVEAVEENIQSFALSRCFSGENVSLTVI